MRALLPRHVGRVLGKLLVAAAPLLVSGCERSTPAPGRKDTAIPVVPPPESTVNVPAPVSTWDSSAGPALFVPGQTPSEAAVVMPSYTDSAALDTARFDRAALRVDRIDLFAGGKRIGTARIDGAAPSVRTDSCRSWPTVRLAPASSDTASIPPWTVGFAAGHAAEVPIDSIEGLASADSAKLAADIARIASALPGDTAAAFRGLPFVVKKAWRIQAPAIGQVLAAIVVRNVNQEANPRQERLLLVAERDTTASSARYSPVYYERTAGLEETLETTDLVAAVLLGAARQLTIVVARDAGSGSSYALLERIDGRWRRRWASAYAGC